MAASKPAAGREGDALAGLERPPWWLPGGDLQTIWAARWARRHGGAPLVLTRERWTTPDGDFIDVDQLPA